jgi:hypothetical protein
LPKGRRRRWLPEYKEQIIRWYYELVKSDHAYGLEPLDLGQCRKDVERLLTAHSYGKPGRIINPAVDDLDKSIYGNEMYY